MAQEFHSDLGKINISEQVIATVVVCAMECYGLVGCHFAVYKKDLPIFCGERITTHVDIQFHGDKVSVTLYIVVEYGVKISEVARIVQERVKYAIETTLGLKVENINVRVQGVRVTQPGRR